MTRQESNVVGLEEILDWFFSVARLVTIVTILTLAAGAAYLFIKTPVYEAEVTFVPAERRTEMGVGSQLPGALGGLMSLTGFSANSASAGVNRWLAVLSSRRFLMDFVRRHDLMSVLFDGRWNPEEAAWNVAQHDIPTSNEAYDKLVQRVIHVNKDEIAGLITLSVEWKDPILAAEWANQIIGDLNDELRAQEIEEASSNLEFLNQELSKMALLGVEQAIYSLMEAEIQRIMLANVGSEFAFDVIDPAAVPDLDDPIRPKPLLVLVGSVVFGFMLGLIVAVLADALRNLKHTKRVQAPSGE